MKRILLCLAIVMIGLSTNAQRTVSTTKYPTKIKPPVLITMIANFRDSMRVPVSMAEEAIVKPLRVIDSKGTVYAISSYQFVYKKKGVTEDEASGRVSPTSTMKTAMFKTTPLPDIWLQAATENLKAGEEFWFVDVIVKDSRGYPMYAPNLKLILQ